MFGLSVTLTEVNEVKGLILYSHFVNIVNESCVNAVKFRFISFDST